MNEFVVIGRVLGDIEVKTSESGLTYAQVLLSVKKPFKNKDGEVDSDVFQFTLFKNLAEEAKGIVKDGTAILVKGHVNSNNYSKDGKIIYNPSLIADRITIVDQLF